MLANMQVTDSFSKDYHQRLLSFCLDLFTTYEKSITPENQDIVTLLQTNLSISSSPTTKVSNKITVASEFLKETITEEGISIVNSSVKLAGLSNGKEKQSLTRTEDFYLIYLKYIFENLSNPEIHLDYLFASEIYTSLFKHFLRLLNKTKTMEIEEKVDEDLLAKLKYRVGFLRENLLHILEKVMVECKPHCVDDWYASLKSVSAGVKVEHFDFVIKHLLEQAVIREERATEQIKKLQMLSAVMETFRWKFGDYARELLTSIRFEEAGREQLENEEPNQNIGEVQRLEIGYPYQQPRDQTCKLLFRAISTLFRPQKHVEDGKEVLSTPWDYLHEYDPAVYEFFDKLIWQFEYNDQVLADYERKRFENPEFEEEEEDLIRDQEYDELDIIRFANEGITPNSPPTSPSIRKQKSFTGMTTPLQFRVSDFVRTDEFQKSSRLLDFEKESVTNANQLMKPDAVFDEAVVKGLVTPSIPTWKVPVISSISGKKPEKLEIQTPGPIPFVRSMSSGIRTSNITSDILSPTVSFGGKHPSEFHQVDTEEPLSPDQQKVATELSDQLFQDEAEDQQKPKEVTMNLSQFLRLASENSGMLEGIDIGELKEKLSLQGAQEAPTMSQPERITRMKIANFVDACATIVAECIVNGEVVYYFDIIPMIYELLVTSQFDASSTDQSSKQQAEFAFTLICWLEVSKSQIPTLLDAVQRTFNPETMPRVRESSLIFYTVFVPRHSYLLSANQVVEIIDTVIKSLSDPNLEVRIMASTTLTTLVISLTESRCNIENLIQTFKKWAEMKLPTIPKSNEELEAELSEPKEKPKKRKRLLMFDNVYEFQKEEKKILKDQTKKAKIVQDSPNDQNVVDVSDLQQKAGDVKDEDCPDNSESGIQKCMKKRQQALVMRHAGVLGLSSLVRSVPFTIPDWIPDVLLTLEPHIYDPLPVSLGLKNLFMDFLRTHKSWSLSKKFTSEQIEVINDVIGHQSYVA